MTPRPSFQSKQRPSSAIFLGSTPASAPPNIPDLPEPPSPGAESASSGLPSPPATVSTGSGSTGDNTSIGAGSTRQRPVSLNMVNGATTKAFRDALQTNSRSHRSGDDDDDDYNDNDNEMDEDNTARLDRRHSYKSASDNVLALQRVKSLTQRNRLAIDKLSSFSRLSTPSPNSISRNSRSPAAPSSHSGSSVSASTSSASSSSHSSSRLSKNSHTRSSSEVTSVPAHSNTHSQQRPRTHHGYHEPEHLSGSETERESQHNSNSTLYSSSEDLSWTPPSTLSARPPTPTNSRTRQTSAPTSPAKALLARAGITGRRPSPSRTPRKRASTPGDFAPYEDEKDVTQAALATVASLRRSPTVSSGGRRTRQPLPKEFRDRRGSLDGEFRDEPVTPHHNVSARRTSTSPQASMFALVSHSPHGPRSNRSSTVRELTRRHQTRWLSEDMGSSTTGDPGADRDDGIERKQGQRGGSAESPLVVGGRSLVGQGLRAAGIMKRDGDDIFGSGGGAEGEQRKRVGSNVEWLEASPDVTTTRDDRERSRSRASGPLINSRIGEGVGPPSNAYNSGAPENYSSNYRSTYSGQRASTSMADYTRTEEDEGLLRTAPPTLRTHRSAYPLNAQERERDGSMPSLSRNPQLQQVDRQYSSPFGSRRMGNKGELQQLPSEHTRLMMESLNMFESNLYRIPGANSSGGTAAATIPDLLRNAQSIVHAADRLNGLLRTGTTKALEEQIDAEVEGGRGGGRGGAEVAEIWRKVGSEYRESLRASDELVRGMTGFLLGVGRVIKESTGGEPGHGRSMSLDDQTSGGGTTGRKSLTPDIAVSSGGSGRRSVDSRRSWEPLPRDTDDTSRRLSGRLDGTRPQSVLNILRDEERRREPSPAALRNDKLVMANNTAGPSSSMRRLFTPREQREEQFNANPNYSSPAAVISIDSQEILRGYEPSPTPASRQPPPQTQTSAQLDRSRTLPPLAIPPPLPSLPSESLIHRNKTNLVTDKFNRRKVSTLSVTTVRPGPMFPAISTPNATTALTPHTVSNSPERTIFPLLRTESDKSTRTNVTFSRPSTVSVSALSGLQEQDNRKRTISSTSSTTDEPSKSVPTVAPVLSGSETERDMRSRTVGVRSRVSLDGPGTIQGDRNGVRSSARVAPSQPSASINPVRRERRRTVTEIFSTSKG